MKKYLPIFTIIFMFLGCQEVGDNMPLLSNKKEKQPIIIVNKNRHLNIAEFWINQIKNPNRIIMQSEEIKALNDSIAYKDRKLTYFKDMNRRYGGSWIKKSIEGMFNGILIQAQYFEDGNRIPNSFFNEIKSYLDLSNIDSSVNTRYALTINYANQRIVPTELALLKKKDQIFFDRNQNSALDIATPIAILHTSKDGKWHFGISSTSSGWIRDKDIAFGKKKEIENYLNTKNFIVTTDAKNAIMIGGEYHDYLRMGVRLPYVLRVDDMTMVLVPTKDSDGKLVLTNATIRTAQTHKGYLDYTPRNILIQAFKFLNAPYGWGGSFGEQDCSKFIQEIYSTVGIKMPRNSSSQNNVGKRYLELKELTKDEKIDLLLDKATIGATIIHLSGHIMLYIGEYKGEPYIIQTVWGDSPKHYPLGRTAVTSLNFNDYISQIDRATNIR